MLNKEARHLVLKGVTGTIRTAEFQGVEHTVVPVVALVEGVIWPVNAETPELVLAEKFSVAPGGWNGRPVVGSHPVAGGTQVSANSPEMLEKSAFGMVFNARIEDKKLLLEAWLDPNRAKVVGSEAERVIERVLAGDPVEVSVGAYVVAEQRSGKFNGKTYNAVWTEIIPDHLAMLPEGATGACSYEMGCGAPRTAVVHVLTQRGLEKETSMETPKVWRSLRERLHKLLSFRADAGTAADVSDNDLRQSMSNALRSTVPGFLWVESIYPADSLVIYACAPEEDVCFMRASYSVEADGKVTLGDSVEEVEPVMTFQVVKKSEEAAASANSQPCGGRPTDTATTSITEGVNAMKEKVKALIACPNNKFTEADATWLEQVPEAHLDTLIAASVAPAKTEPTTASAKTEVTPDPKPLTEEEYLAQAPESIRTLVTRQKAADAAAKTKLVAALKSSQKEFTEEELNVMPVDQLERLSRVAQVSVEDEGVDFSGLGLPRAAESTDDDVYTNPPDGYKLALAARNAKQ